MHFVIINNLKQEPKMWKTIKDKFINADNVEYIYQEDRQNMGQTMFFVVFNFVSGTQVNIYFEDKIERDSTFKELIETL